MYTEQVVLLACQPMSLDVGYNLRLDDIVHLMLAIECANLDLTVYSTPNHHTPAATSLLFSNAGVGITQPGLYRVGPRYGHWACSVD